jgi:acyl carrier protein
MPIEQIRVLVRTHARLADTALPADDADLYRAGLSSHASVNLMLAIEDEFDIEFPESYLKRSTFESISAIARAVDAIMSEVSSAF